MVDLNPNKSYGRVASGSFKNIMSPNYMEANLPIPHAWKEILLVMNHEDTVLLYLGLSFVFILGFARLLNFVIAIVYVSNFSFYNIFPTGNHAIVFFFFFNCNHAIVKWIFEIAPIILILAINFLGYSFLDN